MLSALKGRRHFVLLFGYLKPQWRRVILMAVLLLLNIGLQLLNPWLLKIFIDTATQSGISLSLLFLAFLFMLLALVNQGIAIADSYVTAQVAWTSTNRLRHDLVQHCLGLDLSYYKDRTSGEMIERIDGDVDTLSNFLSRFVLDLTGSVLLLLGMLIIFFTISWLAGLIMLLFSLLALWVLFVIRKKTIPLWIENRRYSARFFGFLSECLQGTEDVRANGANEYMLRRFFALLKSWFPVTRKTMRWNALQGSISLCMFIWGVAIVTGTGTYLWSIHAITVGTVYVMFSYADNISRPLSNVQSQLTDMQQAEACVRRIDELLHTRSTLVDGPGACIPDGPLSVAFTAMTFGYNPAEPVLRDLSFFLPAGRVLGVLGRTGSGKTTLARLLFRLYDPQQGVITLQNIPLNQPQLHELRRHIGLVTQDVQIFHASVRDNLTFFDRSIPDERLINVLYDIGLADWYEKLANGLQTHLGSEGAGLSAGEAQLLALARVFLADPGLVIFDEASSRLDPATERLVERAVDKLFSNRTAIVIAHRLATVQRADEILILEDGRILEHGERAVLANHPSSRLSYLLKTGLEEVYV